MTADDNKKESDDIQVSLQGIASSLNDRVSQGVAELKQLEADVCLTCSFNIN
jgi:hypothetical protein